MNNNVKELPLIRGKVLQKLLKDHLFEKYTGSGLFHLSPNRNLVSPMRPRRPVKGNTTSVVIGEADVARISFAETIPECFMGIYMNFSHYFDKLKVPFIDLCLYAAKLKTTTKIIGPTDLTKYTMVYDAHVTNEYSVMEAIPIELIATVRIYNCSKGEFVAVKPFGNENSGSTYMLPDPIELKFDINEYKLGE